MTEGLRVALLNPVYWPEVRRGSERFARDLADGLIARGQRPRLITSHRGRPSRTVEEGLEVVRVPRPPDRRLRRRMFEDHLTHVPFSYAALVRGHDDVAQALYPTDALAAIRWRLRTGRPAILSYMGLPHRRGLANARWRAEITQRAVAGSSATVALSEAARDAFWRWLGVEVRVIPPGVDLAAFAPDPAARAPVPTIVCAAAADAERKRVPLLRAAFALVRRERPDARLVLDRPRDAAPAAEPGVEIRDLDDRAALAGAYREAWVSALPSVSEAFGLVLAEALACGTPAVGSDEGGIPEVIGGPETGRTFSGEHPAALARALLEGFELATDRATPARCRAQAERFSLDRTVEAYLALYRELLAA